MHIKCRYHVRGEPFSELFADKTLIYRFTRVVRTEHDAFVRACHGFYNRLFHAGDRHKHILDLTRLDALTVYLHHPVLAVDVNEISVGELFQYVSGMEPPAAEQLFGRFGILEISLSVCALYAHLTLFPVGNRVAVIAEKRPYRALGRYADRRGLKRLFYKERTDRSHSFAHAVIVIELIAVAAALSGKAFASRHYELQ